MFVISCLLEFILDSKSRLMCRFAVNYYVGAGKTVIFMVTGWVLTNSRDTIRVIYDNVNLWEHFAIARVCACVRVRV